MEFESTSSNLLSREFVAVVLAGIGNQLFPLTSDNGDAPSPKALLPVGNRPMIDYPLTWLEQSGIIDVLLICPSSHRPSISHHIHSGTSSSSYPSLRVDVQSYDESEDLSSGTCTVLRQVSSRIQKDFVLLPCDFIPPPSLNLTSMLNKLRVETDLDGAIVTSCWFSAQRSDKGVVPEEWGPGAGSTMPIIWDNTSGTLLHVDSADDIDRNNEDFELRMSLFAKYPRTTVSSKYQDSHVYVCKRAVLDVLHLKSNFESFREEFIPWLCKLQYQRAKQQKYGRVFKHTSNHSVQTLALRHSTLFSGPTKVKYLETGSPSDSPSQRAASLSMPSSPIEANSEDPPILSLRVGVVIHEDGFIGRANTLVGFLELNRKFLGQATWVLPTDPKDRSLIDPKSQISSDSMIGDSTQVAERASIKRSVIGKHCVIGRSVKIVGCILLDHCIVADGARLDGSILGTNTKVGAKAELVRCLTQAGYDVEAGETFRNDKLEVSDWAAAPEDDENGSDSEGSSLETDNVQS
ncbi:UDP-3-O-glucosamine N-acyltransferase [Amylostereum chailletii]|nr:UDP-3-O-glucosamine N-acyltransferase [Amylostereum chailletii]